MIRFSSLRILEFTRKLWYGFHITQKDIDESVATPVVAGMDLKEAVLSLQKQIDSLPPPVEPDPGV